MLHQTHWEAAKHVLRYLKGTINYRLLFRKTGEQIHGFVDSDYAEDINDRKSYTGLVFMLAGSPISWTTRKQQTVANSSTEAEYMALTDGAKWYFQNIYVNYR